MQFFYLKEASPYIKSKWNFTVFFEKFKLILKNFDFFEELDLTFGKFFYKDLSSSVIGGPNTISRK